MMPLSNSKLWNGDATLVSKLLALFLMISILTVVGFHYVIFTKGTGPNTSERQQGATSDGKSVR